MTSQRWYYYNRPDEHVDGDDWISLPLVGQVQLFTFADLDGELELFAQSWLLRGFAAGTLSEYLRAIGKYRAMFPGEDITLVNAKAFVAAEMARSHSTGRWCARSLRAFDTFRANEFDRPRVLRNLPLPRALEPQHVPVATPEQIERMLDACTTYVAFHDVRDRAIIHAFRSTGMRLSELVAMTTTSVDLTTGHLTIPVTKTRTARTVRFDGRALSALRAYLGFREMYPNCEALWVNKHAAGAQALRRQAVTRLIHDRAIRADANVTPHSFRRGFALAWLRAGGPQTYVKALAGWKSDTMVDVYTRRFANEEALEMHARLFP